MNIKKYLFALIIFLLEFVSNCYAIESNTIRGRHNDIVSVDQLSHSFSSVSIEDKTIERYQSVSSENPNRDKFSAISSIEIKYVNDINNHYKYLLPLAKELTQCTSYAVKTEKDILPILESHNFIGFQPSNRYQHIWINENNWVVRVKINKYKNKPELTIGYNTNNLFSAYKELKKNLSHSDFSNQMSKLLNDETGEKYKFVLEGESFGNIIPARFNLEGSSDWKISFDNNNKKLMSLAHYSFTSYSQKYPDGSPNLWRAYENYSFVKLAHSQHTGS